MAFESLKLNLTALFSQIDFLALIIQFLPATYLLSYIVSEIWLIFGAIFAVDTHSFAVNP